jgi:hypothetical protein
MKGINYCKEYKEKKMITMKMKKKKIMRKKKMKEMMSPRKE